MEIKCRLLLKSFASQIFLLRNSENLSCFLNGFIKDVNNISQLSSNFSLITPKSATKSQRFDIWSQIFDQICKMSQCTHKRWSRNTKTRSNSNKQSLMTQGRAGQGRTGQGRAGQGRAGQGRAGQGRAGQGRAGQGRAGQGRAGHRQ